MYYKPETQEVFSGHSEIRKNLTNVLFPEVMDDEMLAYHNIFPLASTKPSVALPQVAKPAVIVEVGGLWTQQWEIETATPEEIEALKLPVPRSVTRRQARQALLLKGLLDDVPIAIMNNLADPIQREMAMIEWEDSLEFERTRPLVVQIGNAIGLDAAEMDELFIFAATL